MQISTRPTSSPLALFTISRSPSSKLRSEDCPVLVGFTGITILAAKHPRKWALMHKPSFLQPGKPARRMMQRIDDDPF
jgi:hypothetical protein